MYKARCLYTMLYKGVSRHTKVPSESLWFVSPVGLPRRTSFSAHMGAPCRLEGPWFCNQKRQVADSFAFRELNLYLQLPILLFVWAPESPPWQAHPLHGSPSPALPHLIIDRVIQGQLPRSKVRTPFPSPLASVPGFLFG